MEFKIASIPTPYATQHINTQGPGDARPTALKIVEDQKLIGKLRGKVCFITGCTSGIGVETARALHATGADVYFTARDIVRGEKIAQDIRAPTSATGVIEPIQMELDSFESVRAGAKEFLSKSPKLNLLINNVGIMTTPEQTTKDGFESQFGTNFLGHFLLFKLLEPALLASASSDLASRVVSVSSSGHLGGEIFFDDYSLKKTRYSPWKAYGQSKLANIYLTNEIERRYGDKGLHT